MSQRKGGSKNNKPLGERDDPHERPDITDHDLEELYSWVDSIKLSRPKKNISRDFADGVLVSEILMHFFPDMVERHNYTPAFSTEKKINNWAVLNRKVFSKMGLLVEDNVVDNLVKCKTGAIEQFLIILRSKIESFQDSRRSQNDKPEVDQHHHMSPGRKDVRKQQGKPKQIFRNIDKTPKRLSEISPAAVNDIFKPAKKDYIPKKRVGKIMESDLVPRYHVEEKDQDIEQREETIQILQAKINRLEHLLHLKDMRIEDLQQRVESTRPTGVKR